MISHVEIQQRAQNCTQTKNGVRGVSPGHFLIPFEHQTNVLDASSRLNTEQVGKTRCRRGRLHLESTPERLKGRDTADAHSKPNWTSTTSLENNADFEEVRALTIVMSSMLMSELRRNWMTSRSTAKSAWTQRTPPCAWRSATASITIKDDHGDNIRRLSLSSSARSIMMLETDHIRRLNNRPDEKQFIACGRLSSSTFIGR